MCYPQYLEAVTDAKRHCVADSTRNEYRRKVQLWFEFCNSFNQPLDPYCADDLQIEQFMGFLCIEHKKSGPQISTAITALNDFFRTNRIAWKRSEIINHALWGLRNKYPAEYRHKRPFVHVFVYWFWKNFGKSNNFDIITALTALLVAYWMAPRPGEYTINRVKRPLVLSQMRYLPSKKNAKEIVITITSGTGDGRRRMRISKTNQSGLKFEQMVAKCMCNSTRFGLPTTCLVHQMKIYQRLRCARFGRPTRTDPIFVRGSGEILKYDEFRHFIHYGIEDMAKATGVPLEPMYYTPHSIRIGAATDLARLGVPGWKIQKLGRWDTDIWTKTYVGLDLFDVAKLRNSTLSELRASFVQGYKI